MSLRSFFKSSPVGAICLRWLDAFDFGDADFFVPFAALFRAPFAREADVFRDPLRVFATDCPP
jgi:hypothetical protein